MNLSQEEFAAALRAAGSRAGEPNAATKRLVQRWESGQSVSARPVYRRALEAVTGRPYRELGFAGPLEAAAGAVAPTSFGAAGSGTRAGADPDAEADGLSSAGGDAESTAGPGSACCGLAGLAVALEDDPETGWPQAGARVGAQFVDWAAARTARLRRLDDFLGGADTFELYRSELSRMALVLRQARYGARTAQELAGLLAQQAQQAGWAAFDTGRHAEAEYLFDYSHQAACEAGDTALAGNALALLGYLRNQTGRPGWNAAAAAYEVAAPAPPGVRALLAQRLGWAYAVIGQPEAAVRALYLARGHLQERHTRPVPDWAVWADEREQRVIEGRCWVELGRPARAVELLESALGDYGDDRVRNKALYLTWLTVAYLDARQLDQAVATASGVLEMATRIASPRLARRVVAVTRRFAPYRDLRQVRELLDRSVEIPSLERVR